MVTKNLMKLFFLFFSLLNYTITKAQQDSIVLKLKLAMGDTLEYTYTVLDTNEYKGPAVSLLFGSNSKEKEERVEKILMTVSGIDSSENYILTAEYIQQIIKSKIPVIGNIEYNSDSLN